jgi:hypothetical protein
MTDLHYSQRSRAAVKRLACALASESDRIFWEADKLKIAADAIAQEASVPAAYDLACRWFAAADDLHVRREGIGSLTHALGELVYAMSRDDAASEARAAAPDEAAPTAADSSDDLAGDLADLEDDLHRASARNDEVERALAAERAQRAALEADLLQARAELKARYDNEADLRATVAGRDKQIAGLTEQTEAQAIDLADAGLDA